MRIPLVCLALGLGACTASTESTEIGVRTVNVTLIGSAGVMNEIYPQGGTYFFLRTFSVWSSYNVGLQNLAMRRAVDEGDRASEDSVKFKTIDGNDISVDITVAWSIEPDRAPYLLQFVGLTNAEVEDKLVRPVSRTVVRDVLNQLTSEEYYQADRRFLMALEAQARLNRVLEPEGVHIEQVLLGEHKFNDTYEGIIRDKKVAEQEAARLLSETEAAGAEMKRDLERAKGEVSKTIEAALGEAAQRKLEADAIHFERERQATAILAEKRANAEGLLARGRAMGGAGGKNMVKLRIAESLQGKKLLFVPSGGMDLRTTDMNALLSAYGIPGGAVGGPDSAVTRWLALPAGAALLATMAWWSARNFDGSVGWSDLLVHPERHDGESVVLSLVTVGDAAAPDRFVVYQGGLAIPVRGDASAVSPGEDITLGGRFSAGEGAVITEWIEHRPARMAKKWLGMVGIGFLCVFLPLSWTWGRDGLVTRG